MVFLHRAADLAGRQRVGCVGIRRDEDERSPELAQARAEVEPGIGPVDPGFPLARAAQHVLAGLRILAGDRTRHQRMPTLDPAREALRSGEAGGERHRVREAVGPGRRPVGEAELEGPRDLVRPVAGRGDQRRVEQRQRVPFPAVLQRMPYGRHRRDRVEHADRRLRAETVRDEADQPVHVGDEGGNVVAVRVVARVAAVIALVVDREIVAVGQQTPERVIGIDGEPVAVRHHQPGPVRVAVAAHPDDGAVVHLGVEALRGLRDTEDVGRWVHATTPFLERKSSTRAKHRSGSSSCSRWLVSGTQA